VRPEYRVDQIAGHAGARAVGDAPRDIRHDDMDMNWKFFVGASILATGLLIKVGAPLVPLAIGIAMAALVNWRRGLQRDRRHLP